MGRKHLTLDERIAVIESYKAREKVSVIAAVFNINMKTVNRIVRGAGEPVRKFRIRTVRGHVGGPAIS